MAWTGSAWVLLSFSPFPVRHPGADPGSRTWIVLSRFIFIRNCGSDSLGFLELLDIVIGIALKRNRFIKRNLFTKHDLPVPLPDIPVGPVGRPPRLHHQLKVALFPDAADLRAAEIQVRKSRNSVQMILATKHDVQGGTAWFYTGN